MKQIELATTHVINQNPYQSPQCKNKDYIDRKMIQKNIYNLMTLKKNIVKKSKIAYLTIAYMRSDKAKFRIRKSWILKFFSVRRTFQHTIELPITPRVKKNIWETIKASVKFSVKLLTADSLISRIMLPC